MLRETEVITINSSPVDDAKAVMEELNPVKVRPGVCRNLDLINHTLPEMRGQDMTSSDIRLSCGHCPRDSVDADTSSRRFDYVADLCFRSDVTDLCSRCVSCKSGDIFAHSPKRLNTHDSGFFSDASMECDSDSSVCRSDISLQRINSRSRVYHSHTHGRTQIQTGTCDHSPELCAEIKVDGHVNIERARISKHAREQTHECAVNFIKHVQWLDRNYSPSVDDNGCFGATGITRYQADKEEDDDDVFVDDEELFLSNLAQLSGNTSNKTSTPIRPHKSRGYNYYDVVTNETSLLCRRDVCHCVTCNNGRLVTRSTSTQTTSGRRVPKARARKSINKELAPMPLFDVYNLGSMTSRAETSRPRQESSFLPLISSTLPDVIPIQCPDEVEIGRELRHISDEFDARVRKRGRHGRRRDDDRAHRRHSLDFLYDSLFMTLLESWVRGILTSSWNR